MSRLSPTSLIPGNHTDSAARKRGEEIIVPSNMVIVAMDKNEFGERCRGGGSEFLHVHWVLVGECVGESLDCDAGVGGAVGGGLHRCRHLGGAEIGEDVLEELWTLRELRF